MADSSTMADIPDQPAPPVPEGQEAPELVGPVNEDAPDQVDSTYAPSIIGSETTSLMSSINKYREEGGRTYHSYGSTEHWGPNDEKAQDQQDLSHHLWTLTLKGEYFLSPIKPTSVLDIGTGTGIWVIEVAEQFPDAKVTGIDVSPIQPGWVPQNAFFEIDDYNVEWLDDEKYDLIHARELLGTSPDWPALYRRAFKALKPGGWYEQHEPGMHFLSDHTEFAGDHPLTQWNQTMFDAGIKSGMRFDIGDKIKGRMEAAGFVSVTEYRLPWIVGGWSSDEHQRKIGQWNQLRIDIGIADFCSRRFTNHLGFSRKEVEVFCARLRKALRDKKLFTYIWVYFVYGQKPETKGSKDPA